MCAIHGAVRTFSPLARSLGPARNHQQHSASAQGFPAAPQTILGVDESLYAGHSRTWRTHLIFQSQLSCSALWWLRKPFVQAIDFASGFNRSPQLLVRLVALELVKQANVNLFRKPSGVVTLERPSLRSDGCPAAPSRSDEVLRIGCLGHWTRTVDFHRLTPWRANLARTSASKQSVCGLPLRRPSTFRALTARVERLAPYYPPDALAEVDVVMPAVGQPGLQFHRRRSMSDAIAGLKPSVALRTRSLSARWEKYGHIDYLAEARKI